MLVTLRKVDNGDLTGSAEGWHRGMATIRFVGVEPWLRCWLPSLAHIAKVVKVLESLEGSGPASLSPQNDGRESARVGTGKRTSADDCGARARTTVPPYAGVDLKRVVYMWAWAGCAGSHVWGFWLFRGSWRIRREVAQLCFVLLVVGGRSSSSSSSSNTIREVHIWH